MGILLRVINFFRIKFRVFFENVKKSIIWRNRNKHNETTINKNIINIDIIKVGKGSYGHINVLSFENKNERLDIGNYVSIANNVTFILGGNHQINTFSTYPIKAKTIEPCSEDDAQTKGAIIVEDEVWIGANVTILSGVRVGKGAIIAAGSIVTKDIEPFAIVGGSPARFIKYRIDEKLIPIREKINLIDIDKEKIIKNIDLFYQELNEENLEKIINLKK